jgi:AcrR family transcriptional regulator
MSSPTDNRPTALERALDSDGPTRATPVDALRIARRMWLADQRVDMGALARELGIGRATLYTWVGSRDRLIAEVLWQLADATLREAREAAQGSGPDYVAGVIDRYFTALASFEPARRFLTREPEAALRILASSRTPFQQRLVTRVRDLLEEQVQAGALEPALDLDTLAYLVIRIGESFIYSDFIAATEPDLAKAVQAIRVLLHAPPIA